MHEEAVSSNAAITGERLRIIGSRGAYHTPTMTLKRPAAVVLFHLKTARLRFTLLTFVEAISDGSRETGRRGREHGMRRIAEVAILIALLTCGCASTRLAPIRNTAFAPDADERQMWTDAASIDAALEKGDVHYRDARLEAYLNGVARRLLPHLGAADVQVHIQVLKDPYLNAFALPNGSVYLHSGILARIDNEAQLAIILGHELTHFLERHALKQARTEANGRRATQVVAGFWRLPRQRRRETSTPHRLL